MCNLGHFGTPDVFNRLLAGQLVSPVATLGLRPAFRVVAGPSGVPWAQTVISVYPHLTTNNPSPGEVDWYTSPGNPASIVVVPGEEPANVVFTFPKRVEAPGSPQPAFTLGHSPEQWQSVGLDPRCGPPLWRFSNGLEVDVRTLNSSMIYEYYDYQGQRAARYKETGESFTTPYASGIPINQQRDFTVIHPGFGLYILNDQEFPPGDYVFEFDAVLVPREFAPSPPTGTPDVEYFINHYAAEHPELPRTRIRASATVPNNVQMPMVSSAGAASPGDRTLVVGKRLDLVHRVMIDPGVPAQFNVLSSECLEVIVPDQARSGCLVVETRLGWALSEIEVLPDSQAHLRMTPPFSI